MTENMPIGCAEITGTSLPHNKKRFSAFDCKNCSMKHVITTTKILFVSLLLALSACPVMAQTEADYQHIDSLIKAGKLEEAHAFVKEKHQATSTSDTSFLDAVLMHFFF